MQRIYRVPVYTGRSTTLWVQGHGVVREHHAYLDRSMDGVIDTKSNIYGLYIRVPIESPHDLTLPPFMPHAYRVCFSSKHPSHQTCRKTHDAEKPGDEGGLQAVKIFIVHPQHVSMSPAASIVYSPISSPVDVTFLAQLVTGALKGRVNPNKTFHPKRKKIRAIDPVDKM